MLWVAAIHIVLAILSMADMVCLACKYALTVESMSSAGSVWHVAMVYGLYSMLEFKLLNFIAAEHGRYGLIEDWSEQC